MSFVCVKLHVILTFRESGLPVASGVRAGVDGLIGYRGLD